MSNFRNLIPTEYPSPPEHQTKTAVVNIVTAIQDAIQEEAATLAGEWAESAGYDDANIFMEERAANILAQYLSGFITRAIPNAQQFTDAHASAYLGIPPSSEDLAIK